VSRPATRSIEPFPTRHARSSGLLIVCSETYPPFDFDTSMGDNGAYLPLRLALLALPESVPRSVALNLFTTIPHYIVLMIYLVAAAMVVAVGWFAVLFTGAWPHGMRDFLVQVSNYYYRIWTYITMVDNNSPKFGLPSV
jgi:hypothetical protein